MIIKGKSRSGPAALAAHLGNAEKNERVSLIETRGTVAQNLRGALVEMDAYGAGTRCQKSLYHAAISPEPPHLLTPEQRTEAIDALEKNLGLDGHARVVVMHENTDANIFTSCGADRSRQDALRQRQPQLPKARGSFARSWTALRP